MKVSDMVTAESPFGHMAMALLDLAENIGWGTTNALESNMNNRSFSCVPCGQCCGLVCDLDHDAMHLPEKDPTQNWGIHCADCN